MIWNKRIIIMYEKKMYEDWFPQRLNELRNKKGVSARDMSLSIGQNPGYINNIESGKALPSMSSFFYICEYLKIAPQEFFDIESGDPEKLRGIICNLKKLSNEQLNYIDALIKDIIHH